MLTAPVDTRELQQVWHAALGYLELEVTGHSFATWLEGTRAVALEGSTLVVEARNAFGCDWLNERLLPVVERALRYATGEGHSARFVPRSVDLPGAIAPVFSLTPAPPRRRVVGLVNGEFTLERYLTTVGNEIAVREAKACLGEDGVRPCDPFVVVGDPGLGKTHLIHAIANRAVDSGWAVACVTAGEFTRRFVEAVKQREHTLHDEFSSTQLLVFDDLQVLEGKTRTAEAFAEIIDAVVNGGGHVLVASEADPRDLELPPRLRSRLQQGITARIEPFRAAERRRFALAHAGESGVELPGWAVDRLAAATFASVRDLRGACNAAVAMQRSGSLDLERLDREIVRLAIPAGHATQRTALELLTLVAEAFETTVEDVLGRSRAARAIDARAAAAAVLRSNGHSLPEIGKLMAGRDRSTISGLSARGQALAEEHPKLRLLFAS